MRCIFLRLKLFPEHALPPCQISFYDCFSLGLEDPVNLRMKCPTFKISIASGFNEEYDQLWDEAKSSLGIRCGVVRDANWMKWKLSKFLVLEARDHDDDSLKGYIAFNTKSGFVTDVLGKSIDVIEKIFLDSINALHYLNPQRIQVSFTEISVMMTNLFKAILKSTSWQQKNFTFSFACYSQSEEIKCNDISAANWYLMPND